MITTDARIEVLATAVYVFSLALPKEACQASRE